MIASGPAAVTLEPAVRDDEQRGLDDPGNDGEHHRAADDHDRQRLLRLRADARWTAAAGKRPIIATSVVIRHGRSRFSAASRAACSIECPSDSRRRWKYVTTRIASWIAMPKIEMNPIAAETEKFTCVTRSASDAARAGDGDVR